MNIKELIASWAKKPKNDMQVLGNLFWHRRLPVDFIDKYYINASNPSIMYDETTGLFFINVRNTNYRLKKNHKGATECTPVKSASNAFDTRNFITVCRNPMEENLQWYLVKEQKRKYYSDKHGFEDARLVNWDGKLYLSATCRDYNTGGMGRIVLVKLGRNYEELEHHILEGTCNDCTFCEKNWQPIIGKPFQYVVSNSPTVVVKANMDSLRIKATKGTSGMCIGTGMVGSYRGSSQVIPYKDGYVSIVHHSEKDEKTQHHYWHHFVTYDKDFNVLHISQPYKFEGAPIEFCCGIAIKDDFAYITYSVMDKDASIMRIPMEDVLSL